MSKQGQAGTGRRAAAAPANGAAPDKPAKTKAPRKTAAKVPSEPGQAGKPARRRKMPAAEVPAGTATKAAPARAMASLATTPMARPLPRRGRQRRKVAATAAAAALLALAGTAAALWWQAVPQHPPGGWSPVNAVRSGREAHLLLAGHDVVAYFTRGLPLPGSPRFTSQYQGVSLHFDNAEHQALFEQDPQRYLPQFGGFCAERMARAIASAGDPRVWRIHDGRLYLFRDRAALQAFEAGLPARLARAQAHWDTEVRGSHALLQSYKRMLLSVPR
jgi:YHS domain-containing protein